MYIYPFLRKKYHETSGRNGDAFWGGTKCAGFVFYRSLQVKSKQGTPNKLLSRKRKKGRNETFAAKYFLFFLLKEAKFAVLSNLRKIRLIKTKNKKIKKNLALKMLTWNESKQKNKLVYNVKNKTKHVCMLAVGYVSKKVMYLNNY